MGYADKQKKGKWLTGYYIEGVKKNTKAYEVWSSMVKRCKVGGFTQRRQHKYVGCTTSEMFSNFQSFANWYVVQVGYGLDGYHLDKDILVKGNKKYSESTCVLIPSALNSFFATKGGRPQDLPRGVIKEDKTFRAEMCVDNKKVVIGRFLTAEEAAVSYVEAKETEARRWASRLKDGNVVDPRVIVALENWKFDY